jgi:CotH kinase protein/Chitobiase/beta-hexosaminidase C-terminal domain
MKTPNFPPCASLVPSRFIRRTGRRHRTLKSSLPLALFLPCLALTVSSASAQAIGYSADFEAPAYTPGSIHGQQGWSVEQGRAEVKAGEGRNASAGLVLEPLSPFSQATLLLDAPAAGGSPGFLDFYVSPAATDDTRLEEMLDIDGARIGFFRAAGHPGQGRIWIFDGDGAGGGFWKKTEAFFPIDPVTGRPAGWVRLTLREDFVMGSWDLWVNGVLVVAAAGFQEETQDHPHSYVILGDTVERLVLDDLSIGGANPLGADTDGDGMLNADENSLGSNSAVADRDAVDAAGVSVQQKWLALLLAQAVVPLPPLLPAPVFSTPSAVVQNSFYLTLTSEGAAAVFYTTDGSAPLPANAQTYSGPITVNTTTVIRACAADAAGRTSPLAAGAWIFPDQVAKQPASPWWPAAFVQSSSSGISNSFPMRTAMETQITGAGEAVVAAALPAAPIVVLAVPPSQLTGTNGVYEQSLQANLKAVGDAIWLGTGSQRSGGAGGVKISISGQSTRNHATTVKHSLRVSLPSLTDAGPVFNANAFPAAQFLLRHPSSDSWVTSAGNDAQLKDARYVSDAWVSQWLGENGKPALRHQWVHVFLNSTYWGVYDAVEQHDAGYAQRHAGAGPERRLVEGAPELGSGSVKAIIGSAAGWTSLLGRLTALVGNGEKTPSQAWTEACATLDVPGLIDYMLWNWWLQNEDWPTKNWLASWEGGKWRFHSWDAEATLRAVPAPEVSFAARFANGGAGPATAFNALSHWGEFREEVAARFAELSAEGGKLSPVYLSASLQNAADSFAPVVAAEAARWGGQYLQPAARPAQWQAAITRIETTYIPFRTTAMADEVAAWLELRKLASHRNPDAANATAADTSTPPQGGSAPYADFPVLDSDGDGIPDFWERRMGMDPFNTEDAAADPDGDGRSNLEEYLGRSDPRRPDAGGVFDANPPGIHSKFTIPARRRILPTVR